MKTLKQILKVLPQGNAVKYTDLESVIVKKMKLDFIRQIDNNLRVLREHGVNQLISEEFDYLLSLSIPQLEVVLNEVYLLTLALRDLQKHLLKVNG